MLLKKPCLDVSNGFILLSSLYDFVLFLKMRETIFIKDNEIHCIVFFKELAMCFLQD